MRLAFLKKKTKYEIFGALRNNNEKKLEKIGEINFLERENCYGVSIKKKIMGYIFVTKKPLKEILDKITFLDKQREEENKGE